MLRFPLSPLSRGRAALPALALVLAPSLALAEVPRVVTDIPATGSLVAQVMGDLGQPHVLLPAGGNAHAYQMRPSDAQALQSADLLVWVGPELTPWLDRAAQSLAAGQRLGLLALDGTYRQDFGATGAHDHGDHDHDHEDHEDHDHDAAAAAPAEANHDDHDHEDGHDHDGVDPHAWLDPANGAVWLAAIANSLGELDPEHAADYAANAKAAADALAALDARLAGRLAPLAGQRFVVFHDAYGYFTGHYGLEPAVPVSLGDASTPSAARLAAIRAEIAGADIACAFPETAHDPALIASVTEGSAVRTGRALDPSGSGHEPGPGLYAAILEDMGAALADCLEK